MTLLKLIISQAPDGILFVSDDGTITLANEAMCELSGYPSHELVGQSIEMFLPADLHDLHRQSRDIYLQAPERRPMGTVSELTLLGKDGNKIPVDIALSRIVEEDYKGTVAFVRDMSEARLSERRLRHQATHDELTGLTNRWQFSEYLAQAISHAERDNRQIALLFLDLDGFKSVNDSFGHAVGDSLLIAIAADLRAQVRSSDVVARIGGDEFAVLLRDIERVSDAVSVANKIGSALSCPRMIENAPITTGCSVGVAMYPSDAQGPDALMRCADLAMYNAKAQGRGRSSVFLPSMSIHAAACSRGEARKEPCM